MQELSLFFQTHMHREQSWAPSRETEKEEPAGLNSRRNSYDIQNELFKWYVWMQIE